MRQPETLWHPSTECAEGDREMYWMNDQVCLGEVEVTDLWLPEWGDHACRVRAIDPLIVPDGAVLARAGEAVITTWGHLRARDEDLAVVEAYWIVNGAHS